MPKCREMSLGSCKIHSWMLIIWNTFWHSKNLEFCIYLLYMKIINVFIGKTTKKLVTETKTVISTKSWTKTGTGTGTLINRNRNIKSFYIYFIFVIFEIFINPLVHLAVHLCIYGRKVFSALLGITDRTNEMRQLKGGCALN